MRDTVWSTVDWPLGTATLVASGDGLAALYLDDERHRRTAESGWPRDDAALAPVAEQVRAYFARELRVFDVALAPAGTPFQRRVWAALLEVPYAGTTTYGELAAEVGSPAAARAVGTTMRRTPVSVIIPCHRVVGADGLSRSSGGRIDHKRWLLEHERRVAASR